MLKVLGLSELRIKSPDVCTIIKGIAWEIVVAMVITQTNAGRVLGSKILHPKLKIIWMYPIDRYLKAEMSERVIGIRLYISRALRSSGCEGRGPYACVNTF